MKKVFPFLLLKLFPRRDDDERALFVSAIKLLQRIARVVKGSKMKKRRAEPFASSGKRSRRVFAVISSATSG